MDYMGRRVKKEFQGHGTFFGSVQAYNPSTGFFRITYDDGDSEDLELSEVDSLLVSSLPLPLQAPQDICPRKPVRPKKRLSVIGKGKCDDNSVIKSDIHYNSMGGNGDSRELNLNLSEEMDLNYMHDNNRGVYEVGAGVETHGLDLSQGSSGKSDLNEGVRGRSLEGNEDGFENLNGERDGILNLQLMGDEATNLDCCLRRLEACDTFYVKGDEQLRKETAASETIKLDTGTRNSKSDLKNNEETPLKRDSDSVDHDDGDSNCRLRGRKRKKMSENNGTLSTPDTKLRRSGRRANMAVFSDQDHAFKAADLDGMNIVQRSSSADSIVYDEKINLTGRKKSLDHTLPPKVDLPPSSCNMDLDEVSIFDILSVYAFLRSFSTLLFLSPFEVDDFVASIKRNDSTPLLDSIHVSLLRTIRKHLESLVSEGSVSAFNCLRSLNWDYLDLITWPMFVIEYLLLHSPGHIPGLDLCHLKSFQSDYYKLPVSTKVEILRHLCDDVIEVDAFRSELNRRSSAVEGLVELDSNMKLVSSKRRKAAADFISTSCVTEEEAEKHTDCNSDECYLCKMDGNLICCDGCPSAFHSRCVGVASNQLPEGDWYCPECTINKGKPCMKVGKSIRGAKLLGIDPYGRLYYSSCGYLLVLESCQDQCSFWLYDRCGLSPLIETLDSSPFLYDSIISSICKHWNLMHEVGGTRNDLEFWSYSVQSGFPERGQLSDMYPTPSETLNEVVTEKNSGDESTVCIYSGNIEHDTAEHVNVMLDTDNHGIKVERRIAGSPEVSQAFIKVDCNQRHIDISDVSHIPETLESAGNAPPTINYREVISQVHSLTNYVNCYEFAQTASSVFEDVIRKLSYKTSDDATRSVEEITAAQLKAVSNIRADFNWINIQNSYVNSRKEKCGWCFYCKFHEEERRCLFIMNNYIPSVENFTSEALGIQSGYDRKKHFTDIMCCIICIEDHLHGLLVGPWLNPHYSALWRKCVLEVTNIAAMKNLLLKLEANLHRLALSADWWKTVDSVPTMGSATHIASSSVRVSSKQGISKKGLALFWWRGGRRSRDLFNWKVIPHSLASKAARQGGFSKITGIQYPDSGEYAKMTKWNTWRAAVETSRSVEQLAIQVRELDANIRWTEIGNYNLFPKMDNESKRSVRSFKKVIIRRRCSEGTVVKYLLDFGRRRFIPDIVVKQGSMIEDSTGERKKYWLEESHVPLHLLKVFEEKRITRKSNPISFGKLRENSRILRKPFKREGFQYLFSRAERLENYQCGHCNKDVLIREAVSCQFCEGFFHKRHVHKPAGFTIAVPVYTCHKCRDGKLVQTDGRKGKSKSSKARHASKRLKPLQSRKGKRLRNEMLPVKSKNAKIPPLVITLRRSARHAERMSKPSLHNSRVIKRKKKKHTSKKGKLMNLKNNLCHKKRTPVNSSYWLNGLLLSRKPNDERLMHFKSKMLLILSSEEVTSYSGKSTCSLCHEVEYTSSLTYVACEICQAWYHGDALGLSTEKIVNLIGFKCYKCLNKKPPVCPYDRPSVNNKTELMSKNNAVIQYRRRVSNRLPNPKEKSTDQRYQSKDESDYISFMVNVENNSSGSMPQVRSETQAHVS